MKRRKESEEWLIRWYRSGTQRFTREHEWQLCGALIGEDLQQVYEEIIGALVGMINHSESWVIPSEQKEQ